MRLSFHFLVLFAVTFHTTKATLGQIKPAPAGPGVYHDAQEDIHGISVVQRNSGSGASVHSGSVHSHHIERDIYGLAGVSGGKHMVSSPGDRSAAITPAHSSSLMIADGRSVHAFVHDTVDLPKEYRCPVIGCALIFLKEFSNCINVILNRSKDLADIITCIIYVLNFLVNVPAKCLECIPFWVAMVDRGKELACAAGRCISAKLDLSRFQVVKNCVGALCGYPANEAPGLPAHVNHLHSDLAIHRGDHIELPKQITCSVPHCGLALVKEYSNCIFEVLARLPIANILDIVYCLTFAFNVIRNQPPSCKVCKNPWLVGLGVIERIACGDGTNCIKPHIDMAFAFSKSLATSCVGYLCGKGWVPPTHHIDDGKIELPPKCANLDCSAALSKEYSNCIIRVGAKQRWKQLEDIPHVFQCLINLVYIHENWPGACAPCLPTLHAARDKVISSLVASGHHAVAALDWAKVFGHDARTSVGAIAHNVVAACVGALCGMAAHPADDSPALPMHHQSDLAPKLTEISRLSPLTLPHLPKDVHFPNEHYARPLIHPLQSHPNNQALDVLD